MPKILRTLFALTAVICFVTEIASAQVTPAPMMNPAAPGAPATALPQPKKCQQNPNGQKPNGGCKKKKKKKNKNKNASTGAPPQQGPSQQAPPQQAPHPMTTPQLRFN